MSDCASVRRTPGAGTSAGSLGLTFAASAWPRKVAIDATTRNRRPAVDLRRMGSDLRRMEKQGGTEWTENAPRPGREHRGAREKGGSCFRIRLARAEHVASRASGLASCCDSPESGSIPCPLQCQLGYHFRAAFSRTKGVEVWTRSVSKARVRRHAGGPGAPLLAPRRSAIMRRDGTIRERFALSGASVGAIFLTLL